MNRPSIVLAACLAALPLRARAEPDEEGCHDSPLVTRIPGAWIASCDRKDYDEVEVNAFETAGSEPKTSIFSGTTTRIRYQVPKSKSVIQIIRNYQNALKQAEFTLAWESERDGSEMSTMLVRKGRSPAMVLLAVELPRGWDESDVQLTIVEQGRMDQQVEVDPSALREQLDKQGHVAVYGIQFDTGKAAITSAGETVLSAVERLLLDDPELKLRIEGHTDNQGSGNLELSKKRAEAVRRWLVQRGTKEKRVTAAGYGDGKPVADNSTEEGRARNRRVELVKL